MSTRDIEKVLWFRGDLSPFLVHLTRNTETVSKENLKKILESKELTYGNYGISDARFGYEQESLTPTIKRQYFSFISFTETPLNEIHNLLEISGRGVDLQPYGLIFLKDKLKKKKVSPVIYLNNFDTDKIDLVEALCSLISTNSSAAEQILPYVAVFGKKLLPVAGTGIHDDYDFTWEREWRFASPDKSFVFEFDDVFMGLCPHEEIDEFEQAFPSLLFIDPKRNMKWYAEKLVEARQRANLKNSVV